MGPMIWVILFMDVRISAYDYYRTTYFPLTKEKGLRGEKMLNVPVGCHQEVPSHSHQFRILRDLLLHQQGPTFSYLHLADYTHDYLNMARHYDEPTKELLSELRSRPGVLNDTFFLILGDHGFQRGENKFMSTEQVFIKIPIFKCPKDPIE